MYTPHECAAMLLEQHAIIEIQEYNGELTQSSIGRIESLLHMLGNAGVGRVSADKGMIMFSKPFKITVNKTDEECNTISETFVAGHNSIFLTTPDRFQCMSLYFHFFDSDVNFYYNAPVHSIEVTAIIRGNNGN